MRGSPQGTLTDTGPLFALIDPQGQPEAFQKCAAVFRALELPLVTTWPCLAEVMHLAHKRGGWPMQNLLAKMIRAKQLTLRSPDPEETDADTERILTLMERYQDRPMDAADASLIALAEAQGYRRIFSLDSDFYIYRLANGTAMEVVPEG